MGTEATRGAPKLARRARELADMALETGLDGVMLRLTRTRKRAVRIAAGQSPSVTRGTVRSVSALLQLRERQLEIRTTRIAPASMIERFQRARDLLESGPNELFEGTSRVPFAASPAGPFDGLQLFDPGLAPADVGVLRGLAMALSSPTGADISIRARSEAEAVARSDGSTVAHHQTRLDLEMRQAGTRLQWSTRAAERLPSASALVERFQQHRAICEAEPPSTIFGPTRLLLHPEAGAPLVQALVRLPLRTARVSARLSVLMDPWVVGGLGSRPFDAHGQAVQPQVLWEGGLQKHRLHDELPGTLRVGLGGKPLRRLVGEMGSGVLVEGWRRCRFSPEGGQMKLEGYGWSVRDGEVRRMLPRVMVSGRLPELFRALVEVGSDAWTYGPVGTPALVFEPVEVTA